MAQLTLQPHARAHTHVCTHVCILCINTLLLRCASYSIHTLLQPCHPPPPPLPRPAPPRPSFNNGGSRASPAHGLRITILKGLRAAHLARAVFERFLRFRHAGGGGGGGGGERGGGLFRVCHVLRVESAHHRPRPPIIPPPPTPPPPPPPPPTSCAYQPTINPRLVSIKSLLLLTV
jgi:hypothetical protein